MVVLLLTFLCYTAYHASRKPPSIVKSVLHGDSSADENSEQTLLCCTAFSSWLTRPALCEMHAAG